MKKLKAYLTHYLFGLGTSCWNAGISAVKINGGVTLAAAAAPTLVQTPNLSAMIGVFVAAAIWEAIDYFDDHRLPTTLADLDKATTAPLTATTTAPVGTAVRPFLG
jgi:hypothetical protein